MRRNHSIAKPTLAFVLGFLLFGLLLTQMNSVSAAPSAQSDEPVPAQPFRIRLKQSIPLSLTILMPPPVVALAVPTTTLDAGSETISSTLEEAADAAVTGTDALTATEELSPALSVDAAVLDDRTLITPTEATEALAAGVAAATDDEAPSDLPATTTVSSAELVTATLPMIDGMLAVEVPVILELDFELVVTETLTSTLPATITLVTAEGITTTYPVSVLLGITPDAEIEIELLPLPTPVATAEPTPEPTATATDEPAPAATDVLTETEAVTETATPTATVSATPAPESALPAIDSSTTVSANLRSGPGTTFDIVGELGPDAPVQVVARNEDASWFLLSGGQWIAGFLLTLQPADAPVATDELIAILNGEATATPAATESATPEATTEAPAEATPAATPVPDAATPPTATVDANLRSGPGTNFDIIGGTITGEALTIAGRNADGTWFRLSNGGWISASLVANPPALDDVPVLNDDGTPSEVVAVATDEAPAGATATPSGSLLGLLPTPTPIATGVGGDPAANEVYLTEAAAIVDRYDQLFSTSIDPLLSRALADTTLVTNGDWVTSVNAAVALLRRISADTGELAPPGELAAVQNQLIEAALAFNAVAESLTAVAAGDAAQLAAAGDAIETANVALTGADTAIIAVRNP